ncbi:unnamed protein product [Trichogramma brassicae]|uniref:Peptidase S1 domain-containing protein n=1 Tax=Trichogramma brassicae TaxID=86971 RepID=A0A6H5ITD5_9HYME|nr:unnamed protein product [Trichogramma brassicae]
MRSRICRDDAARTRSRNHIADLYRASPHFAYLLYMQDLRAQSARSTAAENGKIGQTRISISIDCTYTYFDELYESHDHSSLLTNGFFFEIFIKYFLNFERFMTNSGTHLYVAQTRERAECTSRSFGAVAQASRFPGDKQETQIKPRRASIDRTERLRIVNIWNNERRSHGSRTRRHRHNFSFRRKYLAALSDLFAAMGTCRRLTRIVTLYIRASRFALSLFASAEPRSNEAYFWLTPSGPSLARQTQYTHILLDAYCIYHIQYVCAWRVHSRKNVLPNPSRRQNNGPIRKFNGPIAGQRIKLTEKFASLFSNLPIDTCTIYTIKMSQLHLASLRKHQQQQHIDRKTYLRNFFARAEPICMCIHSTIGRYCPIVKTIREFLEFLNNQIRDKSSKTSIICTRQLALSLERAQEPVVKKEPSDTTWPDADNYNFDSVDYCEVKNDDTFKFYKSSFVSNNSQSDNVESRAAAAAAVALRRGSFLSWQVLLLRSIIYNILTPELSSLRLIYNCIHSTCSSARKGCDHSRTRCRGRSIPVHGVLEEVHRREYLRAQMRRVDNQRAIRPHGRALHQRSSSMKNDIGLILLKEKITFDDRTRPVRLAPGHLQITTGMNVTVTGWGWDVFNIFDTGVQKNLKMLSMKIADKEKCKKAWYDQSKKYVDAGLICVTTDFHGLEGHCYVSPTFSLYFKKLTAHLKFLFSFFVYTGRFGRSPRDGRRPTDRHRQHGRRVRIGRHDSRRVHERAVLRRLDSRRRCGELTKVSINN